MEIKLLKRFSKFSLIENEEGEAVVPNEDLLKNGDRWSLLREIEEPMDDGPIYVQTERALPGWLSGIGKRDEF